MAKDNWVPLRLLRDVWLAGSTPSQNNLRGLGPCRIARRTGEPSSCRGHLYGLKGFLGSFATNRRAVPRTTGVYRVPCAASRRVRLGLPRCDTPGDRCGAQGITPFILHWRNHATRIDSPRSEYGWIGNVGAVRARSSDRPVHVDQLPPGERVQFDRTNRGGFSEPLARFWLEQSNSSFNPDAVRYIDNVLARPG